MEVVSVVAVVKSNTVFRLSVRVRRYTPKIPWPGSTTPKRIERASIPRTAPLEALPRKNSPGDTARRTANIGEPRNVFVNVIGH